MKPIAFLLIIFCLFSCESPNDKLENSFTSYIKNNADDPSTFEFIECSFVDTIYKGQEFLVGKGPSPILKNLENDEASVDTTYVDSYGKEVKNMKYEYYYFMQLIQENKLLLDTIKSDLDQPIYYLSQVKFRLGKPKKIYNLLLLMDKELKILEIDNY